MFLPNYKNFLLLESEEKIKFILDRQGPAIYNAYQQDRGAGKPKGLTDASNVIKYLSNADPTQNKEFLQWLTNRYIRNQFSLEDANHIKELLEGFKKYKPFLSTKSKDINSFSVGDLTETITSFDEIQSLLMQQFKKQFSPGGINHHKTDRVKNIKSSLDIMKHLSKGDPSSDKHFNFYIFKEFANGNINWFDVDGLVKTDIETILSKHKDKDFSKMHSHEIATLITGQTKGKLLNWQPSKEEQELLDNKEAIILYKDKQVVIITPKTHKASATFGKGAAWCTNNSSSFSRYINDGPLFFVLIPEGKLLFHFETNQFTNIQNSPAKIGVVVDRYPQIADFFKELAEKHGTIELMKDPSEKVVINKIKVDPTFVTKIQPNKITIDMVITAIENATSYTMPNIVSFIKKFKPALFNDERIKLASITSAPNSITQFEPSDVNQKMVEAAFKERPQSFNHRLHELIEPFKWTLEHRSDLITQDMVDRMVSISPSVIKLIDNKVTQKTINSLFSSTNHDEIVDQLDYLFKNYNQYITDDNIKQSVINSRHALKYVPEKRQTEEIIKAAIESDPGAFEYIKNPSDEIVTTILSISPYLLKENKSVAKRVTTDMLIKAVKEKPQTLIHEFALDNPKNYLPSTIDFNRIYIAAVEAKPTVIKFIDKKDITPEIVEAAVKAANKEGVSISKYVDPFIEKNPSLKLRLKKDGHI